MTNTKKIYWSLGIGLGLVGIGAVVYFQRKKINSVTPTAEEVLTKTASAIKNSTAKATKTVAASTSKVIESGKKAISAVGSWLKPVDAKKISSPFGNRVHPVTKKQQYHNGIDLPVPVGTAVKTPFDGTVVNVFSNAQGGNQVIVKHSNGYQTGYAHLSKQLVKKGANVKKGETIALSGNTGRSTGPHLHLTMRAPDGNLIDPAKILYV